VGAAERANLAITGLVAVEQEESAMPW